MDEEKINLQEDIKAELDKVLCDLIRETNATNVKEILDRLERIISEYEEYFNNEEGQRKLKEWI